MLELLKKIKGSKAFKEWNHPEAYLCSIFMLDKQVQFDFYSKKTKLVTSFKIENDKIVTVGKDERVFQKESRDLEELDINKIKINFQKAKEISDNVKKEKYPQENVTKEIYILQKIDNKSIWNITKITSSFNIINIKLDANTGKIIEDVITSALSFKAKQ